MPFDNHHRERRSCGDMLNSDSAAHGSTPNASRAASQDDELAAGDAPRPVGLSYPYDVLRPERERC